MIHTSPFGSSCHVEPDAPANVNDVVGRGNVSCVAANVAGIVNTTEGTTPPETTPAMSISPMPESRNRIGIYGLPAFTQLFWNGGWPSSPT
jgi:hypothetical protein